MAEIRLGISLESLQLLSRRLNQLAERLHDPEPALQEAADYMVRSTRTRIYRTKTDPDGNPWSPLSEATIERREADGYEGDNILVMEGELARSVHVEEVDSDGFTVTADPGGGEGDSYAGYHQYGTSRMPRRQILGFSQANIRRIATILQKHMLNEAYIGGDDE